VIAVTAGDFQVEGAIYVGCILITTIPKNSAKEGKIFVCRLFLYFHEVDDWNESLGQDQ
jgi:hypothetical protein